jgi:hypothetical protein
VIEDVQAYEKPAQDTDYCDHENHDHSMLSPGRCMVVIIITAQGYLLSMDSTITQAKRVKVDNISTNSSSQTFTV